MYVSHNGKTWQFGYFFLSKVDNIIITMDIKQGQSSIYLKVGMIIMCFNCMSIMKYINIVMISEMYCS